MLHYNLFSIRDLAVLQNNKENVSVITVYAFKS